MKAMNAIVKDLPKDQEVYMYCTGKGKFWFTVNAAMERD
jgi:hypothetical protein